MCQDVLSCAKLTAECAAAQDGSGDDRRAMRARVKYELLEADALRRNENGRLQFTDIHLIDAEKAELDSSRKLRAAVDGLDRLKDQETALVDAEADEADADPKTPKTHPLSSVTKRAAEVRRRLAASPVYQDYLRAEADARREHEDAELKLSAVKREWQAQAREEQMLIELLRAVNKL